MNDDFKPTQTFGEQCEKPRTLSPAFTHNPHPASLVSFLSPLSDCVGTDLLQSWLTLCDPVDCSLQGSSVHRTLQARILEWVAVSSSRGRSWPRDRPLISCISCIPVRLFILWPTWEGPILRLFQSKFKSLTHFTCKQCSVTLQIYKESCF